MSSELTMILEELKSFQVQSKHARVKSILDGEILKVQAEIAKASQATVVKTETSKGPQKRCIDLHEHAFDESDKFVKIHVPFTSTKISDENVSIEFGESSFNLKITGEDKDYRFVVVNLLKPIDIAKSYKKVKSDMISLYLKKSSEGQKWECLTLTEKRLKDQKSKTFDDDKEKNSDDPMGGLMNIMKKMYDTGDPEMKRNIAKAWTEGQEKKNMPM